MKSTQVRDLRRGLHGRLASLVHGHRTHALPAAPSRALGPGGVARGAAAAVPEAAGAKIPVSVLIMTKNEELRLLGALRVCDYFDDVWVVDSQSTDDTVAIAERAGARVAHFVWDGSYPKKKQWALDRIDVKNPWVLLLDADEFPDESLRAEIASATSADGDYGAYDAHLEYHFTGSTLRHGYRVTKRILVHRARARFPEMDDLDVAGMGEQEGHYQPVTTFRTGTLRASLTHDDVSPLASWVGRHNRYSDWEAYLRAHPGVSRQVRRARSRQGRLFAAAPLKPLTFFCYSFVVKRGFLDGRAGFNYAYALSFYYWMIGAKSRELARAGADDR